MASPKKILLISGSLRAGSVNSAVLRTAEELTGVAMTASLYSQMAELPHFNPDDDLDEARLARPVAELRRQLRESDAVLLCTPEYAGALPGSFKNLLDWTVGGGETYGKPMAWINASSRLVPDAAAAAHLSLRAVLNYIGADIVEAACRRIVVDRSAIGADGLISEPSIRDEIQRTLLALADHGAPDGPHMPEQAAAIAVGKLQAAERADWEELFRGYMDFYERTPAEEFYESAWQAFQQDAEVHALGARVDGNLVGIAHFLVHASTSNPPVCYLQDLFTAPRARGRGVGRGLIAAVSSWAGEHGCSRVYWLTHHSNRAARALYDQVARDSGFIRYEVPL